MRSITAFLLVLGLLVATAAAVAAPKPESLPVPLNPTVAPDAAGSKLQPKAPTRPPVKKPLLRRGEATRTPEAMLRDVRSRLDATQALRRIDRSGTELEHLRTPEAVEAYTRLVERNGAALRASWDADLGTPRFLAGPALGEPTRLDAVGAAKAFLKANRAVLKLDDPVAELTAFRTVESPDGSRAVRFTQSHRGIPLWSHDVVVRLDPAGTVTGFSGHVRPTPKMLLTTPVVDADTAGETLVRTLAVRDGVAPALEADPELILVDHAGRLRLAWRAVAAAGLAYREESFVDAHTGAFLRSVPLVNTDGPVTGTGTDLSGTSRSLNLFDVGGTIFMIDTSKEMFDASGTLPNEGKGIVHLITANNGKGEELFHVNSTGANAWNGQENAVSAAFYAGQVYDYYRTVHGRNSIDGKGMNMELIVNFDQNFNNAFWNGQFMVFGNGDGQTFSDLAGSLDVTAHEMSHGVIEHTANLVYEFQPGALNEHMADVFGVSTDFFVNGNGFNWLLGEDVTTPNTPGDALRDMENPDGPLVALNGQQPAHMDDFQVLNSDQDNGGVHINSGIPNRAFFLAADVIGINDAERIWYRTLSQHLVRNSQFVDLRLNAIQAAADLFGSGSAQETAVRNAMDAVGIMDGGGTEPPPPLPDNVGIDFVSVIDIQSNEVLRVAPDFSVVEGISGGIAATASGRPSFSDDGTLFAWVSTDENVYLGFSDGSDRSALSDGGGFSGVALSPDGRFLAANSVFEDGTIFVFDLLDSANDRFVELTTQNSTEGTVPDAVVAADVMEFTADGTFLIYDALNRTELPEFTYEYWDINLLRLADGETFRVFQPLPQGENIGNPTFAQNSDNLIAFDFSDEDGNILVFAYDFQTGTLGTVTNNFDILGRPAFSGDDSQVYYQFPVDTEQGQVEGIWRASIDPTTLNGAGDDEPWAQGGRSPVWFTLGQRPPTPVRLLAFTGEWTDDRVALEWRAAETGELIGFHVERREGTGWVRRTGAPVLTTTNGIHRFDDPADGAAAPTLDYRLIAIGRDGATGTLGEITVARGSTPALAALLPAAPNPFSAATLFRVRIPSGEARLTTLRVYDVRGRLVAEPMEASVLPPGTHEVAWNGRDGAGREVPAGSYVVRLDAGGTVRTSKVTRFR